MASIFRATVTKLSKGNTLVKRSWVYKMACTQLQIRFELNCVSQVEPHHQFVCLLLYSVTGCPDCAYSLVGYSLRVLSQDRQSNEQC